MNINEKGFTYPLTLIVLIVFSLFLIYYCEQFVSEKQIYTMVEKLQKQEYYFANAVNSVEQQLQGDDYTESGKFIYKNGEVFYEIFKLSDELLKINFQGILHTNEQWEGELLYDKNSNKMVKWIERR